MHTPINAFSPGALIVLPPGSTGADLQSAINGAASGDFIEVSGNMTFAGTVTVPLGKAVTVRSDTGNHWVLTETAANIRHFTVNGTLLLQDITVRGGNIGGGVAVNGGALTADAGTVIENCRAANGGGVFVSGGTFYMNDGAVIRTNTVTGDGAGVLVDGGAFHMYGGAIEYNEGPTDGGGIYIYEGLLNMYEGAAVRFNRVTGRVSEGAGVIIDAGGFHMFGGVIEQNQATGVNSFGGGVSILESEFYLHGGAIHDNAAADGGGVSTDDSYFAMTGGAIYGNTARGGGTVTVIGVGDVGTFGGRGGGVMDNFFSVFEMTGGEIRGNRNEPGVNTSGLNGFNGPSKGGGVYVYYGSSFGMGGDAQIIGNAADRGGGIGAVGTSISSNTMAMGGSAAVTGNHAEYGGGACFLVGHTSYATYGGSNALAMSGSASISGNTADAYGGGVYLYSVNATAANTRNTCAMSDQASISGNAAGLDGGGAYMNMVAYGTAANLLSLAGNASITDNVAGENGGGAYVNGVATPASGVTLSGSAVIAGNSASSGHGGGVFASALASLEIAGGCFIANNSAPSGNGGGIHTQDATYLNLSTDGGTRFSGNTAIGAHVPPADATVRHPNIQFASTSIANHPLNNYDINFTDGEPLPFFEVAYDGNGGIGGLVAANIPYGTDYRILSPDEAGISRAGYAFTGWNAQPDGNGAPYAPGDVIPIAGNLTLYAQWTASEPPIIPPPCCIPCCPCRCKPCCGSCCPCR